MTDSDVTVRIDNVSKSFLIPHEKRTTLKEHFTGLFKKMSYEKFAALEGVSFEIRKGEFLGIIGENGSGKSTLLKLLTGIYSPDLGEVETFGKVSPFLELGVGFNPDLTGRENVYLNGIVLGLTKKQIDERFDEIVEFSELQKFIDMKVKNYSSGMFMRLAFSVAIQVDADIIVLDEVLAVGDEHFQRKCLKIFDKLKKEGKTIILVSHIMEHIEPLSDRVILLEHGKMIMDGETDKVVHHYLSNVT
jgi:ABC-type polysaccharide/polyol phosphate transport system ATPase subunit